MQLESITLGQIAVALAFIVGLISSIKYLYSSFIKAINKTLAPINDSINTIRVDQCKDYLVDFLARVERGEEIDKDEETRAYERYDLYTSLGGNSYIHAKWERLMEKREK